MMYCRNLYSLCLNASIEEGQKIVACFGLLNHLTREQYAVCYRTTLLVVMVMIVRTTARRPEIFEP
jgi:hypothetical protein